MIKIIAGKHKGRLIPTLKGADYRPSTARFKEALFSILSSALFKESKILENANILDLFAGTGGLSFEGISRGAKTATLVDINEVYLKAAKNFAEKIGETEKISFLKLSAINLPFSGKKYNLILMDPPYGKDFVSKTLKSLAKNNWLENDAIIVIEQPKNEDIILDQNARENNPTLGFGMTIIDERSYGNSKMRILKYNSKDE